MFWFVVLLTSFNTQNFQRKGPFTSSDCNDTARSLQNQLHRLCTVLLHTALVTAIATATKLLVAGGSLCEQFKSDVAAILE